MKPEARIWRDDEHLYIAVPYHRKWVRLIKEEVDPEYRRWSPERRLWIVELAWEKRVTSLLERFFTIVDVDAAEVKMHSRTYPHRGTVDHMKKNADKLNETLMDHILKNETDRAKSIWEFAEEDPESYGLIMMKRLHIDEYAPPTPPTTEEEWRAATFRIEELELELKTERARLQNAERVVKDLRQTLAASQDAARRMQQEIFRIKQENTIHSFMQGVASERAEESPSPYRVLGLRPDAPIEVVNAAWRALALLHHSDRGGDDAAMTKINVARDQILEKRGVRR